MQKLKQWALKVNNSIKVVALALLLSGCTTVSNWFADDEEIEIRTLPEIQMAFESEVIWGASVGDGVDNYFSRLTPAVGYEKYLQQTEKA